MNVSAGMPWKTVPISSVVAAAKTGFASGADVEDGILQVRMNNITTDGSFDWSKRRRVPIPARGVENLLAQGGDILFNHTNSPELVGKSAFFSELDEPVTFSNHFICLRPMESILDGRFLARWLQKHWSEGRFQALCKQWVNQATVSKEALLGLEIPLPTLEEQKRIAAILDQADELRRKRQRALDRLNKLGQAIFIEMFGDPATNPMGWSETRLGEIVRAGDRINYGVVQPGDEVDSGVPLIRVGDLLKPFIDPSSVKRIDPAIEGNYVRSRLVGDEILIGCVGSIGTVALAHAGLKGVNIARAVARVPSDDAKADRRFLAAMIRSPLVQRYFTAETRIVAQPTLNIGLIVDAPILLPPLDLQREFSQKLEAIDPIWSAMGSSIIADDKLFASLQHRAFRGDLTASRLKEAAA
ncbi:MAG: restriction endonuclease subunit S [Hyphomicrobiaceae bacterium]